jgi:hypothetical protein
MDRPGKSLRIWLPLKILQGYLSLSVVWVISASSTPPVQLSVTGCFPKCSTVVGSLDPCLFSFFLFLFFFLSIRLLASELSLKEEDEMEEELASEEGEGDLTGES